MVISGAVWPDWAIFYTSRQYFFTKVAQICVDILGYFEKCYFLNKNISGYILGNFWRKIGYFLD